MQEPERNQRGSREEAREEAREEPERKPGPGSLQRFAGDWEERKQVEGGGRLHSSLLWQGRGAKKMLPTKVFAGFIFLSSASWVLGLGWLTYRDGLTGRAVGW